MQAGLRALLMTASLLATATGSEAQQAADPRVADIVGAGKIRVGMHLPQFTKDPKTGAIHGHGTGTVIVQIAQALADQLRVKLELVGNPSPPALIKCLDAGGCDVGFLGYVPTPDQRSGLRAAAYHGAVHLSGAGRLADPQRRGRG